jgi:OOP family OmpA-OmpF porin
MDRFRPALLLMGALPTLACADSGGYAGAAVGVNLQGPAHVPTAADPDALERNHLGEAAMLMLGYATESGLRPEFELDVRHNGVRSFRTQGATTSSVDGSTAREAGMVNLWYDFHGNGVGRRWSPYLGAGAGVGRLVVDHLGESGNPVADGVRRVFAYQAGAGVGYALTPRLSLSADYRFLETTRSYFSGPSGEVPLKYRANALLVGLRYALGAPAATVPIPPAPPELPPPPVAAVVDGDDDHDGVPNSRDKCPGTPPGFEVDADGCIVNQLITLHAINFEFNRDTLTGPAAATLDEVATGLLGQPDVNVEIDGYTDSVGSQQYNLALSTRRAAAVKNYLVRRGVPAGRLSSHGYGSMAPVAGNNTDAGRTENRRVEFKVLKAPQAVQVLTAPSTEDSKAAARQNTGSK